jgi:hypothetical protein
MTTLDSDSAARGRPGYREELPMFAPAAPIFCDAQLTRPAGRILAPTVAELSEAIEASVDPSAAMSRKGRDM